MPELSFDRLSELISRRFPGSLPLQPKAMLGGASTRQFFRVNLADAKLGDTTIVAMFVPDGAKPEEIGKGGERGRWPFLEVRDLLEAHGIRVPAVLAEGTEDGWLLVEDLGDDTIAQFLRRNPTSKREIYQLAVRDLARAQQRLHNLDQGTIVCSRLFDYDLLHWEIEHFREWGLEARDIRLTPDQRAIFDTGAAQLATTIAEWPRGFVHRDYQSRNLMVIASPTGGPPEIAWIDFQDALLGPRVYDLVALLSDSYQDFDRPFVLERLEDYADELALTTEDRSKLVREFDWVTVQRKLKDAGRFVFIDRVKGNASFLPFVEPTIDKALVALDRLRHEPKLGALLELLEKLLSR